MSNKVTLLPCLYLSGNACKCFGFVCSAGIQSGQQDAAGCAGSDNEHVRGTGHGAARTQRCWEDHDTVHADR